jgi:hypothetical protein
MSKLPTAVELPKNLQLASRCRWHKREHEGRGLPEGEDMNRTGLGTILKIHYSVIITPPPEEDNLITPERL